MVLNLSENIRVTTDQWNFILEKITPAVNREGEEIMKWQEIGYFTKLDILLEAVIFNHMLEGQTFEIEELIAKVKELKEVIATTVKKENIYLNDFKN